ncbi:hypothetical protein WJX81_000182 [Elliptochloris bilobata]|uniref:5'-3' exonuclease domain-containing protein n=1 Tax=Elliptochloris bilobata TaxID=381761 RepID=A0AAW1QAK9_9CHLO
MCRRCLQTSGEAGRLILVDAMALLYRAHFGFGQMRLANAAGEDTSVTYGLIGTLLNLLELVPPPTHLAIVFDAAGKTFRHELYSGYKGQRPPMPPELAQAVPRVRKVLRVLGLAELRVPGVEADDVIGTVATRAVDAGFHVAIVSPDKDFYQLLRPGLQLLRPPKRSAAAQATVGGLVPYNADAFVAEFAVQPSQWADVLALSGDAADNVPGVAGVGPKTALALLQRFGDLEGVLGGAGEVTRKKPREELSSDSGVAAARLSKRLVSIRTDLDLPPLRFDWGELRLREPDEASRTAIAETFAALQFVQHARRLDLVWASLFPRPHASLR